ncbi:proton-coupled folate transporter-like [Saccoglossus kowalevskii]|uniref:Proton-coupled folate transporter-like n=1 Tax=Saccoglossus kowalevskii TaxID=10224 RepID=A0ABM0LYW8_SACKO|nr:PREDICTED: proton-coupled folate transporter-like [Saccoglossus kowalevskii]
MANVMACLRLVTVEPVMFLYMLGSFLQYTSVQQLIYAKTCIQEYNSSDICKNLTSSQEEYVQTQTSHWLIYLNLVQMVPSVIAALFLGSWSDTVGRKFSMILPCLASCIYAAILIVSVVYIYSPIPFIFIGTFLLGCSGAYITITFAVFSYIADITGIKTRTKRVGILESMTFIGSTVGLLCSGVMLEHEGFIAVFAFYLSLNFASALYILVWLDESVHSREVLDSLSHGETIQIPQVDTGKRRIHTLCSELCKLENIKKTLCVCFKKRENFDRMHLILLAMTLLLFQLVGIGETDVTVLYTKRNPLHWSPELLGYYLALNSFMKGLCLLTVMPLLTSKTSLHDTTIAMIGTVFRMAGYVLIAFSTTTWMMFIVPILMCMAGIPAAAVRSLISKIVNADEQGTLFSFMAACESIVGFLASFVFNSVYPATSHILTGGFVYLLMAVILVIALVLLFWVGDSKRKLNAYSALVEPANSDTGASEDCRDV